MYRRSAPLLLAPALFAPALLVRVLLVRFLLGLFLLALARPARAADTFVFGIDWQAEAAYGGFYQALATGIYARYGLDVTIRQGGPQVNQAQLLLAGRLDAAIAANGLLTLNDAAQNLPLVAIAAMFQKDPAVLIAHPGENEDSFSALKGKRIAISGDTRAGWWNFLKAKYGYTDAQIRPYTFNLQPFLADKALVQQGYLMSEPFEIARATLQKPVVLLVADAGFEAYASLITVRRDTLNAHPDVLRRFVAASIEGWRAYLHGDPAPADRLIQQANPDVTEPLLAFGRQAMRDNAIVEGTNPGAIGRMDPARWQRFTAEMAREDLVPATVRWQDVVDTSLLPAP